MSTQKTFILVLACFLSSVSLVAQFKGSYKISNRLLQSLESREQTIYDVHVLLADRENPENWERYFTLHKTPYPERARTLIKALKKKAGDTQPSLLAYINTMDSVTQGSIRKHWITNAISFKATRDVVLQIAARDDIDWIGENVALAQTSYETISTSAVAPDDIENGLQAINAPAMWAMGYTGYGTTIFTADTGVDPTHPAIKHQYHGNFVPEKQAWYPNTFAPNQLGRGPFDCSNHGTHVTGTVLGLDRNNRDTIGVAFNATWIGGAILCGIGTADNIGAFEWAIDPDGDDDTVDDIPDAINNSWYDPSLNEQDCNSIYVPILHTLELIGIAVVFSAGNEGPDPGTITQPHNININEVNAFTVGALNGNAANFPIASFSSRGPSHCEGEGSLKIKPEVSAPGVSVRSCVPGNDYALLSGTSMAAPHVSGSILLLKEAFPYLGGKELKTALYRSCTDLGQDGEDNEFGMGIINVFAAYEYLLAQGHVPVDPRAAQDAVVLDVHHAAMGCNEEVNPFIQVENNGLDTIFSMVITYGADTIQSEYTWNGVMIPGSRVYVQLPGFALPSGFTTVTVSVDSINGLPDAKPLNNRKKIPLSVTDRENLVVEFEWAQNICAKSDIILTSPLGNGSQHETQWFTTPFGGEPRYTGNIVVVGSDTLEKELFAEVTYFNQTGIDAPNTDKGYYDGAKNEGLVFDALAACSITSFDVYSAAKHVIEVVLLNEKGETLHAVTKPETQAGLRTISVNWSIPPGKNYKIIKKIGRGLFTQTEDVVFPYSIRNIINIKSGIRNDSIREEYKAFYNLQVSYVEPCGRLPYIFDVRPDSSVVKPEFVISSDTLRLPADNVLSGQSLVTETATILWDMGDGTFYNDNEVIHEYTKAGKYKICFHVVDTSQCLTAGIKDIVVLQSTSSQDLSAESEGIVWLYPNPVHETLTLRREDQHFGYASDLKVFHSNGQLKGSFTWNTGNSFEIQVSEWPDGVYLILLPGKDRFQVLRFVKM